MPTLDAEAAWRALLARDAQADGRLFIGVTSTGIYCRPICRVRTPRRDRCRFFATAAQAEAAAFRPCLKCRPEIAPGTALPWSVMDASRTLALQAARRLDAAASAQAPAADARGGIARLAGRLGVSDRHLRRIFAAEHGVSPLQYLQTKRLLLAKQLLTDTSLPVTQVALASGFASLRRFNAAFAASYRMNPTRLRRGTGNVPAAGAGGTVDDGDGTTIGLLLAVREPFDRDALLAAVGARAVGGVEQVDGRAIRRTLRAGVVGATDGWLEAAFDPRRPVVRLRCDARLALHSGALLPAVRRWLGLDADWSSGSLLHAVTEARHVCLPGALDPFEFLVGAVLGEQTTTATASVLATRLAARYGRTLATPWNDVARCFPSPDALATTAGDAVASLGVGRRLGDALLRLARAWPELRPLLTPDGAPAPLAQRLDMLVAIAGWNADEAARCMLGWPAIGRSDDTALPRRWPTPQADASSGFVASPERTSTAIAMP